MKLIFGLISKMLISILHTNILLYWKHVANINHLWSCCFISSILQYDKVNKGAKIRNRYNQVPHLTQDTNGKAKNSEFDTTNENQEFSPFSAGDHKALINRHLQRHSKRKTEKNIKDPQKKYPLGRSVKYFTGGLKPVLWCANLTLNSDVDQNT